jgi:hypothetical protein
MEFTYRNITFRNADGSFETIPVPTIPIPEGFYDKARAERLKEHDPVGYVEYMHEVDEAFIATYFGG